MSFECFQRIDSSNQTVVLHSNKRRTPQIIYWGPPLPLNEDLCQFVESSRLPLGQTMLDEMCELSLCPETGRAFSGTPGIQGSTLDGKHWTGQFALETWSKEQQTLTVCLLDKPAGLRLSLNLCLRAGSDVLELSSTLENTGENAYRLDWLACPVLPASQESEYFKGFSGRWCQEFQIQNIHWRKGAHIRENRLGRASHEHFPGLLIPAVGATESQGKVWGCHLGWSADHRLVAEELPDGRRQVQFGVLHSPGEVVLNTGERYRTPILYAAFSSEGYNGLSWAFHRHCRQEIVQTPKWMKQRPIHYNCWEAIYFNHEYEALKQIVDRACESGAEMFVLDDGWFVGRNDDHAGLGDWTPDPVKYPLGLTPLIAYVQSAGMKFGLWVEPEMVNKNSHLYHQHPDWILDVSDYQQVEGRNQYVLNLSLSEVEDYLFLCLDKLLQEYAIDYFKWDMNRSVNLAAGSDGSAVGQQQTQALYRLLARVRRKHPHVVIESCSSGGGRIDFGILRHTDRVWLSDSNDAHVRWEMQRNASLFFPPEITGSHVGPKTCHTSGRQLSMDFRALVAASRHMGFELDLREMSTEEKNCLKRWSDWHRANRQLLHTGRQYRLETQEPNLLAEMHLASDAHSFIVFAGQMDMQRSAVSQPLLLQGLEKTTKYKVNLVNKDSISATANRTYQSPLLDTGGLILSGAALMQRGLLLPNAFPDTLWVLAGELVLEEL